MVVPLIPLPDEIWKPIPGYPGYQASSLGRIYSKRKKFMRQNKDHNGYLYVRLSNEEFKKKYWQSHRVIALAFGLDMTGHIDHINNVIDDNRIDNLQAATPQENRLFSRIRGGKFQGYSFHKSIGKYYAEARKDGKRYNLGYHETAEQAKSAYLSFIGANNAIAQIETTND